MIKEIRFVRTIAVRDENNILHKLHESVEIVDAGTFADPDAEEEGLREFCIDDGHPVNVIDGGYQDLAGMKYFPIDA